MSGAEKHSTSGSDPLRRERKMVHDERERMDSSGTVEALLSLQDIDAAIDERTQRLKELTHEIAQQEEDLEALEGKAEVARKKVEEAEAELRKIERSVQAGRATLKRLEARAQEVQNMKQHLAARAEVDAARRNLRVAEEDALDAMQDLEDGKAALEEVERELTARSQEHRARVAEAREESKALEQEIDIQRDRKKNRETRLGAAALRLYQKVRSGRTRRVLAPLTQDGVCGNCFTMIPLQRQADIRSGRKLEICEGCGVILYAPPE